MNYRSIIYRSLLCLLPVVAVACSDNEILEPAAPSTPEDVAQESNGPSLNVVVTLDNMGGSRSTNSAHLESMENYIDVEKLRVLFFTCVPKDPNNPNDYDHDYFLFESKSRWVKKIDTSADNSWLVSIPLYEAGNDTGSYKWNWTLIRDLLTHQDFKVAILANRPEFDYADAFSDSNLPAGYLPNDGPVWTIHDAVHGSSFETADYSSAKDVFDLHHCQYDRNYLIKSGTDGYYSFILAGWSDGNKRWSDTSYSDLATNQVVKSGASSSWVDWTYASPTGNGFNDAGIRNNNGVVKHFRHPSVSYPIPMYGIQRFSQIPSESWLPGSPFELSSNEGQHYTEDSKIKTVSLLRSVVKCEIVLPKTLNNAALNMAAVCYSNIYARCEPMDVWTPTNEMWDGEHGTPYPNGSSGYQYPNCEINTLLSKGSICNNSTGTGGVSEYQNAMVWFYGRWKEKGWKFLTPTRGEVSFSYNPNTNYPHIFNPYIQRNQMVVCDDNVRIDEGTNWRYVIYVGERNSMDPSNLSNLHGTGVANNIFQYWMIQYGQNVYAVPITDYTITSNPARNLTPISPNNGETAYNDANGVAHPYRHRWSGSNTGNWNTAHNNYESSIMSSPNATWIPWPLIRNHVYTITLTTKGSSASTGGRSVKDDRPLTLGESFNITSSDNFSKKIGRTVH